MKRIALLTVLLLAVSMTAAFALEVTPSFALTGSGTVTWGVSLDSPNATGFTNASASSLTVSLIPSASSDTHTGKAPMYGSITISNVNLYWVDGQTYAGAQAVVAGLPLIPTVAATFSIDPITIGVFAAPTMSSDAAAPIQAAQDTGFANVNAILVAETSLLFTDYAKAGTWVKYAITKDLSVTLDLTSNGDWTVANENTNNGYAAGLESSITLAPVTLGVGVFQGFNWGTNPLGAYVKASVDFSTMGTAAVGVDIKNDSVTGFEWEVSASAQMNFNTEKTAYLLARGSYTPDTNAINNGMDAAVSLMLPTSTILGPINLDATLYYLNVFLAQQEMGMVAHVGYTQKLQDPMTLAASMGLGFTNVGATSTLYLTPQVVWTLTGAPVSTLTLAYTTGDLMAATPGAGNITVALTVTY